jgi:hypothetical protein
LELLNQAVTELKEETIVSRVNGLKKFKKVIAKTEVKPDDQKEDKKAPPSGGLGGLLGTP